MKHFYLLCFCFIFCSFSEIYSTNIELTIKLGDSLFFNKNYTYALLEYQRAYFFSGSEMKPQAGAKIAECHLAMDDFSRARAYYDSAIYYSESDLSIIEYKFQKIICYILEGNFGYALLKTNDLEMGEGSQLNFRKSFYQGICHFGMKQYGEAYSHFLSSLSENDTVIRNQLQNLFENRSALNRPHPELAMILSIILPGAGQIYAGAFKDGLNSISLLAGLAFLAMSGSASTFVALLPFIYRYYIGGILNAKKAAEYKQKEHQYNFYVNLLTILQK